jgi:hypothetical protein
MTSRKVFNEATTTAAIDGDVVLTGPDGVAVSMTPAAAFETARRLTETAKEALRQPRGDSSGDPPS